MGTIDTIKEAVAMVQKLDNVDIVTKLLDVQQDCMNLQEEVRKLQEENKKLKEEQDLRKKIIFENNKSFYKDDTERKQPFCSACFDSKGKLINLHEYQAGNRFGKSFQCPSCEQIVHDGDLKPPPKRPPINPVSWMHK